MSSAALQIWKQIEQLTEQEQQEIRQRLIDPRDFLNDWPEPAPPGAFANIDTPEEIAEQNALAKASCVKVPDDLANIVG